MYVLSDETKQVKILLKRGHTKMHIFDISGPWVLYYICILCISLKCIPVHKTVYSDV